MKIWDFLLNNENDYDVWDTEIDYCVCCVAPDIYSETQMEYADDFYYDKFVVAIYKAVDVLPETEDGCTVHGKWSEFIRRNKEKLKNFAEKNWFYVPQDEDEFIYQWTKEIHLYLAGYGDESSCKALLELNLV